MARKIPYAELEIQARRLSTRMHILECAHDVKPNLEYTHRDGKDVYRWRLYAVDSHDGGHIIGTFRSHIDPHPRHRVYYVEYLDTAARQVSERYSTFVDCGMSAAVERFLEYRRGYLESSRKTA